MRDDPLLSKSPGVFRYFLILTALTSSIISGRIPETIVHYEADLLFHQRVSEQMHTIECSKRIPLNNKKGIIQNARNNNNLFDK
ncbi:hypothetical protein BJ508DRAFT_146179 [Ascobolus immersus RN42]|uniref:Uncharacterized protein n=1 Tax=Ascobolus immersus RN42 TaxID=1160509 RepID=A0A3N4IJV5_ASCIM|nr:hypothetical protein BJ508DRAFT_146179 [Ascobolus immersus RN42]